MKKVAYSLFLTLYLSSMSIYGMEYCKAFGKNTIECIHALLGGIASVARNIKQSYTAQAETLFYKEDGSPISEKEHEIIYDIKLHCQFPMSILYNNYQDNEIAMMQQQLNQKLPDVKVAFIPTTMYELFFMSYINDKQTTIKKASGGLLYNSYPDYKSYFNQGEPKLTSSLEKTFLNETTPLPFEEINKTLEVKKCHLLLNNYIVYFLKKRYLNPSIANQLDYLQIYENKDFEFSAYQQYRQRPKMHSLYKDHLEKIVTTEYDAEKTGQWLLYRGTSRYDNKPANGNDVSLCFGNSLFAGYRFDPGATAHFYMCKQRIGYLLPLSKKEYVHGELNNMFHIPPLTTIAGLVARGEFFHARSKITNPVYADGFFIDNSPIPSFYTIDGNLLQCTLTYRKIFNYIQQHRINIKGDYLFPEKNANREPLYDLSSQA